MFVCSLTMCQLFTLSRLTNFVVPSFKQIFQELRYAPEAFPARFITVASFQSSSAFILYSIFVLDVILSTDAGELVLFTIVCDLSVLLCETGLLFTCSFSESLEFSCSIYCFSVVFFLSMWML